MAASYFPHIQEKEREFRPHIRHTEPVLTECGLDWKSRLRWIPEPRYSDAPFPQIKDIKFPSQIQLMRSFPQANMVSQSEWTFYPNFGQPVTFHAGKRCFIDAVRHGSKRCTSEQTLESTIGRKRKVEPGFGYAADSRTYLVPEYSPNFHKLGSTLPKSNFGYPATFKADTFIPLQPLSEKLCVTYAEKKKILEREEEILQVNDLNKWRPAAPLFESFLIEHRPPQPL
ncbi:spermatogenesis-associated serine-rich protein 1 [Colossoma macropomum]|uniref:spermatogenesis-associated serine-rich protein 1 n=1 Tax=Colossoma macropomum TaxID=42526 RepID=UPI0018653877|nr:spermatogenesis-associated serine-rich protein 1 [Colossoma macropomum]